MNIIINGRFLAQPITGVQRYARELVQALDAILDTQPALRVTVFSPRLATLPKPWRNIALHQVGHLQGHAWEQLELPWYSRGTTLFCPGNTAPIASLLSAQPTVVTVHDLSYRYFPEAYSRMFRLWYGLIVPLTLRWASAVVTVSESERRAIIDHYPAAASRLHAIQNGGPPTDFNASTISAGDRNPGYMLYVGSLSKRKNFPGVLEVAIRLARKRSFRFVLVGGVPDGIFKSDLGIPADVSGNITFAGHVADPATLSAYYQQAACFVFPSFYEASPLPPIEAMACGCPVVASDIPSLRERCGNAAIYCSPQDIDSIAATVERVVDDAALQARLKDAGYKRSATFTWDRCARDTLDVLLQCSRSNSIAVAQKPASLF